MPEKDAVCYEKLDNNAVHCFLCAHHCRIQDGKFGFCQVRQNLCGELKTLVYGRTIANHVDPVEKKPLYHFLPGSAAFSIATVGCNFHCGFCQNWQISQLSAEQGDGLQQQELPPEQVVQSAQRQNCSSIAYTYTEPTVFFEYARDAGMLARQNDIRNIFVTNGYMTRETLDLARPWLDAANVDLKSFREEYYRKLCKATLQPVLDAIRYMKELGIWLEITTLIIPGENDSEQELHDIAGFIAAVDPDIPWHISRFHPDYRFQHTGATPIATLERARQAGREHGLRYVYLGNVLEDSNTYCPGCGETVVQRGYAAAKLQIDAEGACVNCGQHIAGVWQQ